MTFNNYRKKIQITTRMKGTCLSIYWFYNFLEYRISCFYETSLLNTQLLNIYRKSKEE